MKLSPAFAEFAEQKMLMVVGTTRRDGSVQMNPVWFEYRDELIWLNGATTRGWVKHVKRDGRVTLYLQDPVNHWKWAQIQGRLVDMTQDGADDHIDRLSQRYLGTAYRNPKIDRIIVRIEPTRITGQHPGGSWV